MESKAQTEELIPILLVDDNETILGLLHHLDTLRFANNRAAGGGSGLHSYKAAPPEIFIQLE